MICILYLVYGHYVNMLSSNSRPRYIARLQTPYINTSGMCMELYFKLHSTNPLSKPKISIIAVDEEKEERTLVSTENLDRVVWERLIARLPDGVHQVVVQGNRSALGYSGMSIDDIIVQPCGNFGEFFYRHLPAFLPSYMFLYCRKA